MTYQQAKATVKNAADQAVRRGGTLIVHDGATAAVAARTDNEVGILLYDAVSDGEDLREWRVQASVFNLTRGEVAKLAALF